MSWDAGEPGVPIGKKVPRLTDQGSKGPWNGLSDGGVGLALIGPG